MRNNFLNKKQIFLNFTYISSQENTGKVTDTLIRVFTFRRPAVNTYLIKNKRCFKLIDEQT